MSPECIQSTSSVVTLDDILINANLLSDCLHGNWEQLNLCPLNDVPIPFEHTLWPFLMAATDRVERGVFPDQAWSSLEGDLLRLLHQVTFDTLYREFSAFRSMRNRGIDRLGIRAADAAYREFTLYMLRGEFLKLLNGTPGLLEQTLKVTHCWIRNTRTLADRLEKDHALIEREFAGGSPTGPVVGVSPAKSDPHNGGQTVVSLQFASGLRLIYKPRSTAVEQVFAGLVRWINEKFPGGHFREVKSIDCGDYGWVEFVEAKPCADELEAALYFERAGMLMALVYLLGAMDCHGENLLATGTHPVLVDLETVMRPDEPDRVRAVTSGSPAQRLAIERFNSSVMASGLLPRWDSDGENGSVDVSGLGGLTAQTTLHRHPKWADINSDAMRLIHEFGEISPSQNVAMIDGRPLGAANWAPELRCGFEDFYRFVVDQKAQILAPCGPLEKFSGVNLRVLFRSTTVYADILESWRTADALRQGCFKQQARKALSDASWMEHQDAKLTFQIEAEAKSLADLDVPYFTLQADSKELIAQDERFPEFFQQTPLERARAAIAQASEQDLLFQTTLISASLRASSAIDGEDAGSVAMESQSPLSAAEFDLEAARLADSLVSSAIVCPEGTASWLGVSFLSASGRFNLQPVGMELYGGTSGISLFLAAADRLLGGGYRQMCLGALKPLRQDIKSFGDSIADWMGIGGVSGIGSLVFGLAHTGRLLDDDSLISDAKAAARLLNQSRAWGDIQLDLISGSAGAALALLALHTLDPEPWMLEAACEFGGRLVEARVETTQGLRAWPASHETKAFTGISHGAAGISLALLRLFQATGETSFQAAALEGIEYERALFDSKQRNWADVREPLSASGAPFCRNSWCHGAPGIALARIGGLEVVSTPQILEDIELGLATTLEFGLGSQDHFCCGGSGRLETLIEAAHVLNRPDIQRKAAGLASQMVCRARQLGGYQSQSGAGSISVGLYAGDAGVGYTLLRLAHPGLLPSIGLLR